jgi:hypothetical protein
MKNLLRSILNWLDRKFPDRVEVTPEKFDTLLKRLDILEKAQIADTRIKAIETEITKLNVSLGFVGSVSKLGPFQR